MSLLRGLSSLRTLLTAFTGITALYIGLVAFGNITDFDTNKAFVQHVFAMDTTFRSPHAMWRAITSPGLATTGYVAIIAWETLTALVLAAGFVAWLRKSTTDTARRLSRLGWLMQVVLFTCGFIVIGGEWFQMWQSSKWNGIQPAFQNTVIAAIGLVLAHLPQRRAAESPVPAAP
ncbi:DUF2165 domain-containing protein [Amycolatopsis sp. NPDC059027]|uniref:DUF2165 domain-containing protein n=1 Tax=unclassified Amycolatopsis TaxID=2618356 RepID=UPI00366E287B